MDLAMNIQGEGYKVQGESFRIEQVITNLLNNAIRHTPAGGLISISAQDLVDKVLIAVENTGEHIPEAEMQNIWEKFYKIEKSRNREMGGTGIGLAVVKNILNLHDSEFGVSNTDNGVEFYFTLNKQ